MRPASLTALALVAVLTACGSDPPPPASGSGPTDGTATAAPTGPLEGTWEATITRRAYARWLREAGHPQSMVDTLMAHDRESHAGTDFTLDFWGDYFYITGPDGTDWHHGNFRLERDRIVLDDEAPGWVSLRFDLTDDTVTFSGVRHRGPRIEFLPGVPDHVPGAALWCTSPWHRQG